MRRPAIALSSDTSCVGQAVVLSTFGFACMQHQRPSFVSLLAKTVASLTKPI